jgi:hypothetical protein
VTYVHLSIVVRPLWIESKVIICIVSLLSNAGDMRQVATAIHLHYPIGKPSCHHWYAGMPSLSNPGAGVSQLQNLLL